MHPPHTGRGRWRRSRLSWLSVMRRVTAYGRINRRSSAMAKAPPQRRPPSGETDAQEMPPRKAETRQRSRRSPAPKFLPIRDRGMSRLAEAEFSPADRRGNRLGTLWPIF